MDFTEKNIEDLIYENLKKGKLDVLAKRGIEKIKNYSFFSRQVDLGEYGRLDLVGINYLHQPFLSGQYKSLQIAVFEIKKGQINKDTLFQAIRYCKGIEQYLLLYELKATFEIFLIGMSVASDDFCYATDFIDNLNIYTVKLDLEQGIKFKEERGYRLNESKFKIHNDINSVVRKLMVDNIRKKVTGLEEIIDDDLPF